MKPALSLVVASVFPPTSAIAMPLTVGLMGTGVAAVGLGHVIKDKDLKKLGKDLVEIGSHVRNGSDGAD
jgi:hypothetical protein